MLYKSRLKETLMLTTNRANPSWLLSKTRQLPWFFTRVINTASSYQAAEAKEMDNQHKELDIMNRIVKGITASSLFILSTLGTAVASSQEGAEQATKGINAFKVCYGTELEKGVVGAPELTIKAVVTENPKMAEGTGAIKWASPGPAFKDFESPVKGPWYFMCTMKSCKIRFDFSSPPGAKGIKGMLVIDNWGSPGTFEYEFAGSPGVVKQKAAVCN
jgi:hypothetical protein